MSEGERIFAIASSHQIAAINELMLEAFAPYVQKLKPGSRSGPYPWLAAAIENGDIYNCLVDDKIVGVVSTTIQGSDLVIGSIGVASNFQRHGIGSWLLKQVEHVARQNDMQSLSLQTAEMMSGLLRLYCRHGYVETHRALPEHGEDEHLRIHFVKNI